MSRSSSVASILQSVDFLPEPVRVHGLSAGAHAWFIAKLIQRHPDRKILILGRDDETAASLREEVETVSRTLRFEPSVGYFPSWEQSPYSPIQPSLRTRTERVAALSRIRAGTHRVWCSTFAAAVQTTLSPERLAGASFRLRVGDSVESREALTQRLQWAGYLRSDTVEDRGTYGFRGEIVDFFPPELDRPIRVELFGDEIEKIRAFEPDTQKTVAESERREISFGPGAEFFIRPDDVPGLRASVKAVADELGVSRTVRDPVMELIQPGNLPSHGEFWNAYVESAPQTLLSHLQPDLVVYVDELSIDGDWDAFWAEQKDLYASAAQEGLLLPEPARLFDSRNALLAKTARKSLYIDRIEMASLEEREEPAEAEEGEGAKEDSSPRASHRAFTKANTDFSAQKRHTLTELEPQFGLWMKQGFSVAIFSPTQSQIDRMRFLLSEHRIPVNDGTELKPSVVTLLEGTLREGFRWPAEGVVVITDHELLGGGKRTRARRSSESSAAKEWSNLQALGDLNVGEAVVHIDHGIGRYQGLVKMELGGSSGEFLLLEYANKDKLYLPVYRLNVIQKYMGVGEGVQLDRLGTPQFEKAKEKVRESVKKLAIDLVQLYAERRVRQGLRVSPRDGNYREFEAKFPFDETPDQLRAIDAALDDMETAKVMDRLICGDVGYGKTEVAIRAAFKMVSEGHQVAVLVPTTVLAHQHEQSFRARMKDYPIRIESVSRFKSAKEQKAVAAAVEEGKVDIVIGTHRLLSKDVKFRSLGLVIIDEEHRFGVEHKERLKTFRVNTHVLTLSATPIPRTLHMALSGLRDISLINTAPVNRLPIRTYISKYDENLIQRAIRTELARGGQVFFVHNRVQSIFELANSIRALVPEAKIVVGHGQMKEGELENVMMAFYRKEANVLVSTTIIESGLDIPSANTMIVNRADAFGLAQLYQLRGRVGRGQTRAYAYLLIPAEGMITEDAKRRLEVIQKFVELGSGFSIASHDLEIRGGGDLLGAAQSGHIATVGFDLYTELLEEAIRELQGKPLSVEDSHREPEIKVPYAAFLSEAYVPDVHQRLALYRRLSGAAKESEIDDLEAELQDRFGKLPEEARNLLWLIRVKQMLKTLRVDALTVGPERVVLQPGQHSLLDPVRAISLVSAHAQKYQLTPDSKFVAKVKILSLQELYFTVSTLLRELQFRIDPVSGGR